MRSFLEKFLSDIWCSTLTWKMQNQESKGGE